MSNSDLVNVSCIDAAMEGFEGTFEERCRRAFHLSKTEAFLASSDEDQFRAALAWILSRGCETEEERERSEYTISAMKGLAAATSGVPVDMASILMDDIEPYPFQMWFQEEVL